MKRLIEARHNGDKLGQSSGECRSYSLSRANRPIFYNEDNKGAEKNRAGSDRFFEKVSEVARVSRPCAAIRFSGINHESRGWVEEFMP